MRNRIVLIRPPSVTKGVSFVATQFPLNIASIAANLLRGGYDVEIWDFDVEVLDERLIGERLRAYAPMMAGISCYTPTVINGHAIASLIKKAMPSVVTVVGGPHVSALPEATLKEFQSFDAAVVGEGEEATVELADAVSRHSPVDSLQGVVVRKGDDVIFGGKRAPINDLDGLPFPARHLLKKELYTGQSHRGFSRSFLTITEIMTSRGCPNRCIFCASDVTMGRGVRFRSPGSVKREIGECVERYGCNHFTISDDTFTLREERLYEICDEFARRKLTWNCNARVWPLSRKMLTAMARSGCEGVTYGVESGSPRILKEIRKNITLDQVRNAFAWSREAGIRLVEADVIIGSHPSETKEDISMTRRLLIEISPDIVMISVIVPYPGTEVYEIMRTKGLIENERAWDSFVLFGKEPSWRTENFAPKELLSIQRKMIREFYFRPSFAIRMLGKMKSLNELMYWIRGGSDFILKPLRNRKKNNVRSAA
ncbi:MAG: radical SAM protein [Candidatus Omnitrophota bacterium]